mmetsp:Transcript_9239/g.29128  ORF Transcript_9239/g.29128 Transcript_9239/m.29128 type:complete len:270 (-) Transcript_9239:258-1067(-)
MSTVTRASAPCATLSRCFRSSSGRAHENCRLQRALSFFLTLLCRPRRRAGRPARRQRRARAAVDDRRAHVLRGLKVFEARRLHVDMHVERELRLGADKVIVAHDWVHGLQRDRELDQPARVVGLGKVGAEHAYPVVRRGCDVRLDRVEELRDLVARDVRGQLRLEDDHLRLGALQVDDRHPAQHVVLNAVLLAAERDEPCAKEADLRDDARLASVAAGARVDRDDPIANVVWARSEHEEHAGERVVGQPAEQHGEGEEGGRNGYDPVAQ